MEINTRINELAHQAGRYIRAEATAAGMQHDRPVSIQGHMEIAMRKLADELLEDCAGSGRIAGTGRGAERGTRRGAETGGDATMGDHIDIVFDGPPSHQSGRFVEVEDASGRSIKVGEWIDRGNGYWVLRIRREDLPEPAMAKSV